MEFRGYLNADGSVGCRNHVVVLAPVQQASIAAAKVASLVDVVPVTMTNTYGMGEDRAQLERTLLNFAENPNIASILILDWKRDVGRRMAEKITNKPVEFVDLPDFGGTIGGVARSVELAQKLVDKASMRQRQSVPLSKLITGTHCSGTDASTSLCANPVVGVVSDKVIADGGTSLQGEPSGLFGVLCLDKTSNKVKNKVNQIIDRMEKDAQRIGSSIEKGNPTKTNILGGITTMIEKSLGSISKGGTSPLLGALNYGEKVPGPGNWIMETPGLDGAAHHTGLLAGGAQVILFTTGAGHPIGSPIAPTIKITGNPKTWADFRSHTDFECFSVIEGKESKEEAGQRLFDFMIEVLNGKLTCAEILGHREFSLARIGSTL